MSDAPADHRLVQPPFLVGEKVYLRPLTEADISEAYLGWLNDPEVTRYLEVGRLPVTVDDMRSYIEGFRDKMKGLAFAIFDKATQQHIGNVTLYSINWIHRTAEQGTMIGNKEFWRKGYAPEARRLVIEYAFRQLGLHKITVGALAANGASIAVSKKLGFKIEGVLRQQWFKDGAYHDVVRLGLLSEEFYEHQRSQMAHSRAATQGLQPGEVADALPGVSDREAET